MGKPCAEYRASARSALAGKYWYAFGLTLLVSLAGGLVSGICQVFVTRFPLSPDNVTSLMLPYTIVTLIVLALGLFFFIPLSIGLIRYFILSAKGINADINELKFAYRHNLMNVVGTVLKEGVFIYLWSLLFVIPGIVKEYSYYMVDYIIAENPDISSSRAFEISKKAMYGYKAKAFLLNLSFIGWALLCILTAGIGFIFLAPYIQAASVQLYLDVKANAFEKGIITDFDLPR